MGRSEGIAASTNPFLSPKASTPKKKIRLTPRRINFNSVETTLMSPSFFSVEASVPGAGGMLSGGLDSPRGFVGEQVLLRPVPQPGGFHAGGISVENDLFAPPRGSVSSNPFKTAEDVGGALLRNDLSALHPGSPSRNMFQPEKTVERPMSRNDSSVLPQKTPSLNPFTAEHVGVLARSEPVRVRMSANSVRGSFIKSLGRQHRLAQVIQVFFIKDILFEYFLLFRDSLWEESCKMCRVNLLMRLIFELVYTISQHLRSIVHPKVRIVPRITRIA